MATKGALTPDELLRSMPEASIQNADAITPVEGFKGVYTYNQEIFDQVPHFDWNKLFSKEFLGDALPGNEKVAPPPVYIDPIS